MYHKFAKLVGFCVHKRKNVSALIYAKIYILHPKFLWLQNPNITSINKKVSPGTVLPWAMFLRTWVPSVMV